MLDTSGRMYEEIERKTLLYLSVRNFSNIMCPTVVTSFSLTQKIHISEQYNF